MRDVGLSSSFLVASLCGFHTKEKLASEKELSPGRVAQWVGASLPVPKGCGFDSQSGRTPGFGV